MLPFNQSMAKRKRALVTSLSGLQEYCIACPSTGTLFSLKTGEIMEW